MMTYTDDPNRVDPPEDIEVFEEPITHSTICKQLSDPDFLWEAIGRDGVADPYPWGNGFYQQRQNAIQHERVEEALLLAIAGKDYQALGEIVFDQVTEYARSQIENRS
tara:strand:+ start:1362 stop:1685 length:324 start_codon:yes stop_codon:yes gene_type:complete